WKTAALLRIMKVMSTGLQGGTSFMEDYTYHFDNGNDLVLGSHMLEVCPTIATAEKPILAVQPLGLGGKAVPARLIFNTHTGPPQRRTICRGCRWPTPCGKRSRICVPRRKPGSSPAARTIPSSAMR
ncbi:hypothetical protein LAM87_20830, partial [Mycobacterium tuberculosis]|nr:hypothetical protein [Mycobacterium tuberculosis]